jgi:hypothetical protein
MEVWKSILGYEGLYEVSDMGRVRSVDRMVPAKNGTSRFYPSVIKSQRLDKNGYPRVNLTDKGVQSSVWVHTLVLNAFVGPMPEWAKLCRHLDDVKTNNTLANLQWGTQSENEQDKIKNGRNKELNKTHCPRGHLLKLPNLVACDLKKGHRNCKACGRARATASNHFKQSNIIYTKDEVKKIADEKYAVIMLK